MRDASLNLARTLPSWCLPPDLGPKLYLAYGALNADGSFLRDPTSHRHVAGTCLHVDMADAVNICAHVEPLRAPAAMKRSLRHATLRSWSNRSPLVISTRRKLPDRADSVFVSSERFC